MKVQPAMLHNVIAQHRHMQDRLHGIDAPELFGQRLLAKRIDVGPGAKDARGHGGGGNFDVKDGHQAAAATSGSETTSKFFTKNQSIFASSRFA
jgi:hypothetical protein